MTILFRKRNIDYTITFQDIAFGMRYTHKPMSISALLKIAVITFLSDNLFIFAFSSFFNIESISHLKYDTHFSTEETGRQMTLSECGTSVPLKPTVLKSVLYSDKEGKPPHQSPFTGKSPGHMS